MHAPEEGAELANTDRVHRGQLAPDLRLAGTARGDHAAVVRLAAGDRIPVVVDSDGIGAARGRGGSDESRGAGLLDGDGLREVPRLVDVQTAQTRDPVGEQLQRHDGERRLEERRRAGT